MNTRGKINSKTTIVKRLLSVKKRLDSEYFQKYNRKSDIKSGDYIDIILSDWDIKCIAYNETDYKVIDVIDLNEEDINNDIKRVENSDYDKVEGAERARRRMGSDSGIHDNRGTGGTDTGLSGRRTDGNQNARGREQNIENAAGLRGDRILKQIRY